MNGPHSTSCSCSPVLLPRAATFVDTIAGTKAQIVDTRKTIHGLRFAQKYAVRVGSGNHWPNGMPSLIKENHILAAGGITPAVKAAQAVAS